MLTPDHWNHICHELHNWFQSMPSTVGSIKDAVMTPANFCLLVGAHGIGKTTFLRHFSDVFQYSIQWITPDKCETSKDLIDQLNKYIYPSVENLLDQTDSSKVFIGIDDWDILVGHDRSMFLTLQQFLQSRRSNPYQRRVICLCTRACEKKFADIHPSVKVLTMRPMSDADKCLILKQRFPTLNLGILTHLTDHCQENLHRAIEMAQFEVSSAQGSPGLRSSPGSQIIANDQHYLHMLEMPETIPTLATLYESKTHTDWLKLFAQDPWMIPLRFHENLYKELENRTGSKLLLYDRLHSALILWDRFMSHWINDEDSPWMDLPILVLTLSICLILEPQRRLKKLKHSNESMMDFTKLLSQLSLQKKGFQTLFHKYNGSQYPIYEYPYHWIHEN